MSNAVELSAAGNHVVSGAVLAVGPNGWSLSPWVLREAGFGVASAAAVGAAAGEASTAAEEGLVTVVEAFGAVVGSAAGAVVGLGIGAVVVGLLWPKDSLLF
jgi:hypothetical protein